MSFDAPARLCAAGDERLGQITSIHAQPDGQAFALGYVRCRRKGQQIPVTGRKVQVGSATGELVEVPFLSREFEPQHAPPLGVQSRAAAPDARCDHEIACDEPWL